MRNKIVTLTAIGLSSMLSLFAAESSSNDCGDACGETTQDSCLCCNCCGPVIDECTITPNAGPSVASSTDGCGCGSFNISADFLYWFVGESDQAYAVKIEAVNDNAPSPSTERVVKSVDCVSETWSPGFRVDLGWNLDHDGWDIHAEYTWIQPSSSDTKRVTEFANATTPAGTLSLTSPYFTPDNGLNSTVSYDRVSADWNQRFNMLDLDIGRHFWLSQAMTLRPFFGLRGAWNTTDFSIKGTNANLDETVNIRFERDFWGIGFVSGFNTTFQFTNCFALYGDADFALLWGHSDITRKASHVRTGGKNFSSTSRMDCRNTQLIVDLGLGFRYQNCWCDDQYRLRVDLGWEHHAWLNHSKWPTFTGSERHVATTNGDLTLSGFVARARFSF